MNNYPYRIVNLHTNNSYYAFVKPSQLLPGDMVIWEELKTNLKNSSFQNFRQNKIDYYDRGTSEILEQIRTSHFNSEEITDDFVKESINNYQAPVTPESFFTPPNSPGNTLTSPIIEPILETFEVNLDLELEFDSGFETLIVKLAKTFSQMNIDTINQFITLCQDNHKLAFLTLLPFFFSILGPKIKSVLDLLLVERNFSSLLRYIRQKLFKRRPTGVFEEFRFRR